MERERPRYANQGHDDNDVNAAKRRLLVVAENSPIRDRFTGSPVEKASSKDEHDCWSVDSW